MSVHGRTHEEACTCQGVCCGLDPFPTRPLENVLVALRGSFERGKLPGVLSRSQAVASSAGVLGEAGQVLGWAVALPRPLKGCTVAQGCWDDERCCSRVWTQVPASCFLPLYIPWVLNFNVALVHFSWNVH